MRGDWKWVKDEFKGRTGIQIELRATLTDEGCCHLIPGIESAHAGWRQFGIRLVPSWSIFPWLCTHGISLAVSSGGTHTAAKRRIKSETLRQPESKWVNFCGATTAAAAAYLMGGGGVEKVLYLGAKTATNVSSSGWIATTKNWTDSFHLTVFIYLAVVARPTTYSYFTSVQCKVRPQRDLWHGINVTYLFQSIRTDKSK